MHPTSSANLRAAVRRQRAKAAACAAQLQALGARAAAADPGIEAEIARLGQQKRDHLAHADRHAAQLRRRGVYCPIYG